jgi:hypothetical protein
MSFPLALEIVPVPEKGSHVLDGEDEPVPFRVAVPNLEEAPVPVKDVTVTALELQSIAMVPLYLPLKATVMALACIWTATALVERET